MCSCLHTSINSRFKFPIFGADIYRASLLSAYLESALLPTYKKSWLTLWVGRILQPESWPGWRLQGRTSDYLLSAATKNTTQDDCGDREAAGVIVATSLNISCLLPLHHQGTEKLILFCVLPSFPLPLQLYSMTSGFFSFLCVICLRERITISSPGEPWPAKPSHKILSNAAIFVHPALPCAPSLYTKHGWWQGVSSMISKDNPGSTESSLLFSACFQLFFSSFCEANVLLQDFSGHRKCQKGKIYIF